jgi:glucoamylase
MSPAQGYRISRRDSEGRFSFVKEVIADPMRPCVLLHTKIEGNSDFLQKLNTYVLCAPYLEVGGEANNAHVIEASGRQMLVAEKQNRWIVVGASCDFSRLSCGYVGHSDGYTDLLIDSLALQGDCGVVDQDIDLSILLDDTRHGGERYRPARG